MSAPLTADDYASAARALLPRGLVWPDDAASEQGRLVAALALAYARSDAAAIQLLADVFPGTTVALLTEWEETVGLPDAIFSTTGGNDQRRNQIVARLIGAAGQSRARFIAFAAQLGFAITITNHAPFRAGRSHAGETCGNADWLNTWTVTVTGNGGGLASATLKAALDQIRPAETFTIIA